MIETKIAPVLVVDDEWIVRNQLTRALLSVGVGCDQAVDGDDALFKFRSCDHSLVVTDLRMPHSNGHSLAVSLLAEPKPPTVIVLTGLSEPKLARDLLARGVRDVVFKPVNYFELADRLKEMLPPLTTNHMKPQVGIAKEALAVPEESANDLCDRQNWTREKLETEFLRSPPDNLWLTLALRWFDWHEIPDPPSVPFDLLEKKSAVWPATERRREDRTSLPERAVAIPLNSHFEPVGEPFKLLIRDLSFHGIGMFHTQPPEGSHLALMWRTENMQRVVALVRIVRCRPDGEYFDIGGVVVQ